MTQEIKERSLERDDYIKEGAKTFDDLTSDEQTEILDDIFINTELGDIMSDMHDNESLHDVILAVHNAWQERNGLKRENFNFTESMYDILFAYDKALLKTLTKKANNELEYKHNCIFEKDED